MDLPNSVAELAAKLRGMDDEELDAFYEPAQGKPEAFRAWRAERKHREIAEMSEDVLLTVGAITSLS